MIFFSSGDNPNDYGKQRLWGAVGWGLLTIISGFLIDLASIGQTAKNYMPSFYLVVSILFINILAVARIKVVMLFLNSFYYSVMMNFFSRLNIVKNQTHSRKLQSFLKMLEWSCFYSVALLLECV